MWKRFRFWLRREQEERDLDEEIRAHLAMETREKTSGGASLEAARMDALKSFGNLARIREETRESWGWSEFERLTGDFFHGLRMMRKTPLWTAIVVATLTLGIGLSTAIFSVVYGVLVKPLPYPQPGSLVAIWNSAPMAGYQRYSVNAMNWIVWRERSRSFEDIALARLIANYNLTGAGEPQRLQAARASANLFSLLRARPLLGRVFTEQEQNSDAKVAVLSYSTWQIRFGGDPAIIGRNILLNDQVHQVIGVMPGDFWYPTQDFELWTPLYIAPDEIRPGENNQYAAVGRLKPGVTVAQAQADLSAVMRHFAAEYPKTSLAAGGRYVDALVEPLLYSQTLQVRTALWVLLAGVGCLLLTGCLNLGVLLIARVSSRFREIAIRSALGAGGGRLQRQLLAELIPLGLAGAAGGVGLAWALLASFSTFLTQLPRGASVRMNAPALEFATAASLSVVLLAGLFPARLRSAGAVRLNSRSVTGRGTARSFLIAAQVSITVVLLFGGTLFARSLAGVLRVNPGFRTQGVLTMHLTLSRAKYPQNPQVAADYERIASRVEQLSGVSAAGFINRLPLSGIDQTGPVEFQDHPDKLIDTDWRSATPGYFLAIGIPLKQGRLFNSFDRPGSPLVALIDEQLARRVFGAENPIGKRVRIPIAGMPWTEIIGVVGHILNATPEQDLRPQIYWPESQRPQDRAALAVRVEGKPESFTSAVIGQIRAEDPDQPVYDVRSMDEWMSRTLGTRDMITWLLASFGGASLVLACLGLYGVVSYVVMQRTREFGIRMALGAGRAQVGKIVFSEAGRLVLAGCAVGLVLALPAGRAIQSLLYGVGVYDASALLAAPAILILVALLACVMPARRAARTDPASALRAE